MTTPPPDEQIKVITFAEQKSLDWKRLVATGVLCRSKFARLFNSVSIKTGAIYEINCKSWRCKRHRTKWANKWSSIIQERLKAMDVTLLVNLTTAEMTDHETIFKALKRFMEKFRVHYGPTEYIKVVEYNQAHTQPHFHLLVSCTEMKLGKMPAKFRELDNQKLSWPMPVFEYIKKLWGDCLEYFAPNKKRTTVVWCQPPVNQGASTNYAVGYVTGGNKNEEPDETWKGRKITYSKKFFDRPVSEIWQMILEQMHGPRDPEDKFFWLPNDAERIIGETPFGFQNNPTLKARFFEAQYYSEHGFFPLVVEPDQLDPDYYDIQTTGQEAFNSM